MTALASQGQLRASIMRWALLTVPACVLLGFLSGLFASPDSLWFQSLEKPAIYPPPATFGVVWTILYAMMGFALALVCAAWGARGRSLALVVFGAHFMLNLAWPSVFFGAYMLTGGFLLLIAIVLTLLVVIWAFWRVRSMAGLLLLPYLAWVLFASVMAWQFMVLNPQADGVDPTQPVQRIDI